jgi:hypothetical protein
MASGFDRFINSILHERTATPMYTTFAISWALWNWKVIYFTLFISEETLPKGITKLQHVEVMLDWSNGFWLPLLSTVAFIFFLPHFAILTYKQSVDFRAQRIQDKSDIIDKNRRFTRDESDAIRTDALERIAEIEKENVTLRSSRSRISDEHEQLKKDIQNIKSDALKFSVTYAWYGSGPVGTSAGEQVKNSLNSKIVNETELTFVVNIDTFEIKDPAPNYWKGLVMAYQVNGHTYALRAIEGDRVSIKTSTIGPDVNITNGDRSKNMLKVLADNQYPVDKGQL